MITERTLRKWRKEALVAKAELNAQPRSEQDHWIQFMEILDRILRMTQELLDLHMLRKVR